MKVLPTPGALVAVTSPPWGWYAGCQKLWPELDAAMELECQAAAFDGKKG